VGDEQFGRRRTEALVQSGELLRNGIPRLKPPSALAGRRAKEIRVLVEEYYARTNPGVCCPWTAREEKALTDLVSTTRLCGFNYRQLLEHREVWPGVNHKQRPSKWLRNLPSYARTPPTGVSVTSLGGFEL
jgi:hypothetical protein